MTPTLLQGFPCRTLSAGIAIAWALVLITPFCGYLFACGCDWPWAGLAERCNIHDPASPLHCPWCSSALLGFGSVALPLMAGAGVAFLPNLPLGLAGRICLALIAVTAALQGWGEVTYLLTGYPRA